jgi:transcriptional regulator GlxA family with amidase domain
MNFGIYVYSSAEVLDFSGPFEVFATAARIRGQKAAPEVFLVGETGGVVEARGGYRVVPAFGFRNHPQIDVLIVPGGVHTAEMAKPQVIAWIARTAKQAALVASVCTGVFLLAEAKVITTENVTTHWEDIADLRARFPDLTVHAERRWVDEGPVVTSAGISAGIDMSLHLVERLLGRESARKTANQMEYDWAG